MAVRMNQGNEERSRGMYYSEASGGSGEINEDIEDDEDLRPIKRERRDS